MLSDIFSKVKLFLIAKLRNNYLSPKCSLILEFPVFSRVFSPQYIFGNILVIGLEIAHCSVIVMAIVPNYMAKPYSFEPRREGARFPVAMLTM